MKPSLLTRAIRSQAALALAFAFSTAAAAPAPALAAEPLLHDVISAHTLSSPPTTSQCLALFGIHCYQPAQFDKAYDMAGLHAAGIDGHGRTIAIVDSFGSPTIANDLHVFDQTFGLPDPSLEIIQPSGPVPAFDPNAFGGDEVLWAEETTLDVEWAHVFAPGAKLLLVETPVDETEGTTGLPEMMNAEKFVIDHHMADVITQSFGATENTFPSRQSILNLRYAFQDAFVHHVTVLGASGDLGATDFESDVTTPYPFQVNSWPSSDPLVTSLGGTQLTLDDAGNRLAPDVVWNDGFGASGGGPSHVFSRPAFQTTVRSVVGAARGTPDISMSAAVDGAVVIYFTFVRPGFHLVGGTSEASPEFAGIVAMADQLAGHRLGWLNQRLYVLNIRHAAGIVDVTSGNNSFAGVTGFSALAGYDMASGVGTIDAARFVPELAGLGR